MSMWRFIERPAIFWYAEKEVVPTKDDVVDDCLQIALEDAQEISKRAQVGDMIHVEIKSKKFGLDK